MMEPKPPHAFRRLIRVVSAPEDRRFIVGDLDDEYTRRAEHDVRGANWWYRGQVVRSLPHCLAWRGRTAFRQLFRDARQDLWLGARTLGRTPWMALATVLSLGLGMGAVTAVFTVGNAFLLKGSSDEVGDDVVAIFTSEDRGDLYGETSLPDYESIREAVGSLAEVAALRVGVVRRGEEEDSERAVVEIVTHEYLEVAGATPVLGRFFAEDETRLGFAAPVVVLSFDYWRERFGGGSSAIGETLVLDGVEHTVIGVAPEGFLGHHLRMKVDLWVPVGIPGGTYHATPQEWRDRRDRDYSVVARMVPGQSISQVQGELDQLAGSLASVYPEAWTDDRGQQRSFSVLSHAEARVPPSARGALAGASLMLLLGTGVVLLMACANVAGLLVARGERRRKELAVRSALGAGRVRLLRLLFVESALLAGAGGALGLYLASWARTFFESIPLPIDVPIRLDVPMDGRVVAFALFVSVGAALFFGLLPALSATRVDLAPAIRGGRARGGRARSGRLRQTLVVLQVSGALILVSFAGLFLRSLLLESRMELGLDPTGLAVASIAAPEGQHSDREAVELLSQVRDRVVAGVAGTEAAYAAVVDGSLWDTSLDVFVVPDGFEAVGTERPTATFNAVGPAYFDLLGLQLLRGRGLDHRDVDGMSPAIVVSQSFADRYWPGGDPIGRAVRLGDRRMMGTVLDSAVAVVTVVGVVRDVASSEYGVPPRPRIWMASDQFPHQRGVIVARSRLGPETLLRVLRQETRPYQESLAMVPPQTLEALLEVRLLLPRVASRLLTVAGSFTLLLALVGIHGVVSYSAARRVREMAIRRAMGASGREVVRTVVREGVGLTLLGLALGLGLTLVGSFLARSVLSGVSPLDPLALGGSLAVLTLAAVLAGVAPAVRARRIHPMDALREE